MHIVTQVFVALVGAAGAGLFALTFVRWLRGRRRPAPEFTVASGSPPPSRPPPPPGAMACPACGREYGPGIRFCPADARALVPARPAGMTGPTTVFCPRCRRSFESHVKGIPTRFCPLDAEELIAPASSEVIGRATGGRVGQREATPGGKICPNCGLRYGHDATHCGRDGIELVALN